MAEGITFNSLEEAQEYARQKQAIGQDTKIAQYMPNVWKVFFVSGGRIVSEPEDLGLERITQETEEEAIEKGIAAGKRKRKIETSIEQEFGQADIQREITKIKHRREAEKTLKLSKKEEVKEALEKASVGLAVKKALQKTPIEKEKALLEKTKDTLARQIEERRRRGHTDPGVIVPVFDPKTHQVIDYRIEVRGTKQRLSEWTEKGTRKLGREMLMEVGELPVTATRFAGGVVTSASQQMNVRKGMTASIPGQAPSPRAIIARLPTITEGAIGTTRPAIGRMGTVDLGKVITPEVQKKRNIGFAEIPKI